MTKKNTQLETLISEDEKILIKKKPQAAPFIIGLTSSCIIAVIIIIAVFCAFYFGLGSSLSILTLLTVFNSVNFLFFKVLFIILFCVLPLVILVGKVVLSILEYKNTEYIVTNKRIFIASGALGVDYDNVYFHDIDSVRADVTFFEKLFGVGTVVISSDNKNYYLQRVTDIYNMTNEIQRIVNEKKTDMFYPNNRRAPID